MLLPTLSDIIGDLYYGFSPRLFGNVFTVVLVTGIHLVPILLCFLICHWRALGAPRFLPIIPVYLLIFYGNFIGPRSGDGLWVLETMSVAFFCIPVFFCTLVFTMIITSIYYIHILNVHNVRNSDPNTVKVNNISDFCKFAFDDLKASFKRMMM
jgi:hypothetical protein